MKTSVKPTSTKKEREDELKFRELVNWLRIHNNAVFKKYEHHLSEIDARDKILNGLIEELNPEDEMKRVLTFATPYSKKVYDKSNSYIVGSVEGNAKKATESLFYKEVNKQRFDAGINPITLLTEKKRKIILNALSDIKDVNEDKSVSMAKLDKYLKQKEDEEFARKDTPNLEISHEIQHSSSSTRKSTPSPHHGVDNNLSSSPIRFQPQWDHYDTMKARWRYIQPQVKQLIHEKSTIAPNKKQSHVMIEDKVIMGNVQDINYFQNIHNVQNQRKNFILSQTIQLKENEKEKLKKSVYIPQYCVRY